MGRFRIALSVALIGTVAAGCARASAVGDHPHGSSPTPRTTGLGPPLSYGGTLSVGPPDSGTPISLGAGNTLVFTVGSPAFPSGLAWGVASSPVGYLFAFSHSQTPPFSFQARRAGDVVLTITVGPGCAAKLLGQSNTPCSSGGGPVGIATRVFIYHIKVFGRGG